MEIRVNGIIEESIVDGPGIRYVIFTQGCFHNCPECHNPESHSLDGGYLLDTDKVVSYVKNDPLNGGVTFSGGEPMLHAKKLSLLCDELKQIGKHLMVFSGFTYEEILADPEKLDFLSKCDILVDGKFILAQKSMLFKFKGSANQRVIDVQKSLKAGEVILSEYN